MKSWHIGNASDDSAQTRGWFVGHFLEVDDIRLSDEVEIKWGIHPRRDRREEVVTGETRTTVLILISGRFRINLGEDSFVLENQGDYAMWGAGVDHTWEAEEDSVMMTIRWPSIPT